MLNNEAFRHTAGEQNQESWIGLLHDLKFFENMDDLGHVSYLRQRFVMGFSHWMAGNHGSLENTQLMFGYSDVEWREIWSLMNEDGAWAVPPLRDNFGNFLKDNHAPELFIRFAAHELKCHIIVFDMQLKRMQFCSGNILRRNNVIFSSPLLLYATGSHFQSVFQKDHEYFIELALQLEIENNGVPSARKSPENVQEPVTDKKLGETSMQNKMKSDLRNVQENSFDKFHDHDRKEPNNEIDKNLIDKQICSLSLEELKNIKAKD